MLRKINTSIAWAAITLLALTAFATSASASSGVGISPSGSITLNSSGRVTFTGGAVNVACDYSFAGTIASSVAKVAGAGLGSITSGTLTNCGTGVTGAALFVSPASWPITYNSFAGTLPSITSVNVSISGWQISITTATTGTCLYTGSMKETFTPPRSWAIDTSNSFARSSGGIFCPALGKLAGAFTLSTSATLNLI